MKLSQEELQKFQGFKTEATRLASYLGELNYQKTLIDLDLETIKQDIKSLNLKQKEYLKELGATYGDGSINVETGEITSLQ